MAQEKMEVSRAHRIDRDVPIRNIHVDENGNKWVADTKGIFFVQSTDFAKPVTIDAAEWSLLSVPDGNYELNLPRADLEKVLSFELSRITTAQYDALRDDLYIGTRDEGVFHLKTKPALQLVNTINSKNSKLRSDNIQTILSTFFGQVWIGTDDGLLLLEEGKDKLFGKYFSIEAMALKNRTLWVVSEGEVLEMNDKGEFYGLPVTPRMVEGQVEDIAFDSEGRLWVASEIVIRYNFETSDYDLFGPAQAFTSQFVNCIAVDQDDALWVGTEDKGVYFIGKASTMSAELVVTNPLSCDPGARDAALQVRASGGQPPYTYQWTGELSGDSPQDIGPGTYAVTVTDKSGRSIESEVTIEDVRLKVSVTQQRPASPGEGADGQASVTVSPENGIFRFQWDNGEKTRVASRLSTGEHSVTITGDNGCSTVATVNIGEELAPLAVALEEAKAVSCPGGEGAVVRAVVSGGQGPYLYQWNNPAFDGEQAQGLAAGDYQVTVTDGAGNTAMATITVSEPPPLTASIMPTAPASTNNADGQARVRAEGGSGDYTFQWDTGETNETAEKLAAGVHSVTVTDAAGCTTTVSVEIGEDILPLGLALADTQPVTCAGGNNGSATVEVSGGKGPFGYLWSTGQQEGNTIANLEAGDYEVTVTDATGATAVTQFTIVEPAALAATIVPKAPASTNNSDGQAKVSVSGGSGPYSFQWDTGETGETAEKLGAGSHSVTITDDAGCTTTAAVAVAENILPLGAELIAEGSINCAGEGTVSLRAEVSGGKGPFQYQWSTGQGEGTSASGLAAGDYQVTITDATGNNATATITVQEPPVLKASAIPTAPASTGNADGKARVSISGGQGDYAYSWDNGETGETAAQLAPGPHTVTITDAAGCTTTATVEVGENILPLNVELLSGAGINCAGEATAALKAEVSGGKGPFQFQWSTGSGQGENANGLAAGDYQLTVTDAAGNTATTTFQVTEPAALATSALAQAPASTGKADGKAKANVTGGTGTYSFRWDNGETSETATQLSPGTHTVTITDDAGCTATAAVEISENILPLGVELLADAAIKCAGERGASLRVEVSGGKGPFQYQWSTSQGQGQQAQDLPAGDYQVTVTDAAGNSATATLAVAEPAALTATISVQEPASTNNSDGKAKVNISGGSGDYTIRWDNGETAAAATQLAPGAHTVTVSDAAGCTTTASTDISEDIQPLRVSLEQTTGIKCAGEKSAALAVDVQGGKPPFQYQWNNGSSTSQQLSSLGEGTYAVTVTDASGQTQEAQLAVKQPAALTATLDRNKPVTNEDTKDGKATLKVEGGSGSYTISWDNGEAGANAEELTFGPHSVTVTDANGCSTSLEFETEKKILPELTAGRLRAGQTLQVSQIYFDADSTKMKPESFPVVREIAQFLEDNPLVVIEVGGHTNNIPPHEFCDKLSTARAQSVAEYIVDQGVDPNRVVYKGYGKRQPKYANNTEDGRRRNQRVEIKILRLN